jgi:hypothetical protein
MENEASCSLVRPSSFFLHNPQNRASFFLLPQCSQPLGLFDPDPLTSINETIGVSKRPIINARQNPPFLLRPARPTKKAMLTYKSIPPKSIVSDVRI